MKTNYEYYAWPRSDGNSWQVTVDKVEAETGKIVKVRKFNRWHPRSWWKRHGFSFNGRLTVTTSGVQ